MIKHIRAGPHVSRRTLGLTLRFSTSVTPRHADALRKGGGAFLAALPSRNVDSGARMTVAPTAAQTAKGLSSYREDQPATVIIPTKGDLPGSSFLLGANRCRVVG